MTKIKLLDNSLLPYDYLCHHIVPSTPAWSREVENPDIVVGIADYGLNQLSNYPNQIKCSWVIEPSIINGEDYLNVIKRQDEIDYIFMHDLQAGEKIDPKKFVYIPHGGTHLQEDDMKIHDKTKLVSFIFSNKQWCKPHSFRHEIYPHIKDIVDCYGTGCDRYIKFKSEGLNDYCFSIAMENYDSPGLFTEKLIDCFQTGTIPIFYGTKNIGDYFNIKGFFQFETLDELRDILKSLSFEKYKQMIPFVIENYMLSRNYLFPEKIIEKFLCNV